MATTCSKCGEALLGSRKFCASCGAPAPNLSTTLESKAHPTPAPRAPTVTEPPPTRQSSTPVEAPPPRTPSGYGPPPPLPNVAQGYGPPSPHPPPPNVGYAAQPPQTYGGQPAPQAYGTQPAPPPAYGTQPVPPPAYGTPAAGYAPYQPPPQGPPPYVPPPYAAAFVAGARVLVQWADGNRYPGFVQQVAPGHCLIVFPDGQNRWVELPYLTLAR